MRPIFTVHAGEFLVADYIERNLAKKHGLRVWVPSKDDGIDLLVTTGDCRRTVSLQVKFSKCFDCERDYDASGWWLLSCEKIKMSSADYWVFVLPKFKGKRTFSDCCYFVITPKVLLNRMQEIHDISAKYYMYLTVEGQIAIETRNIKASERRQLFNAPRGARDFSKFLNAWHLVLGAIGVKDI